MYNLSVQDIMCKMRTHIHITGQLASIQLYDYRRTGNFHGHEIFAIQWNPSIADTIGE